MKNFQPYLLALTVASLSLFAAGCNNEEDRRDSFAQNEIVPGKYVSERCFKNKLATLTALGADRFSTADVTINSDQTGSGNFRIFDDAGCTHQISSEAVTFSAISVALVDDVRVLKMVQSGSVVDPTWYIPFNLSNNGGGYSLDVDSTDGESGPYITEPSPTDVASFKANPAQGVAFKSE